MSDHVQTELAIEPNLQILRRHRRSLLLRLERPHQSALENHVHRTPRLGRRRSVNLRIGITPADVYFGRGQTILLERERIKRNTTRRAPFDAHHSGASRSKDAILPRAATASARRPPSPARPGSCRSCRLPPNAPARGRRHVVARGEHIGGDVAIVADRKAQRARSTRTSIQRCTGSRSV